MGQRINIDPRPPDELWSTSMGDGGVEGQRLDCIYEDKPLGFEKDLVASATKIQPRDPLEEIDFGDGTIKRMTCISVNIDPGFKIEVINLLREYKDSFAWDYNEMLGLSSDLTELKLPIKLGKKSIKKLPRRFAPEVMSKIKE